MAARILQENVTDAKLQGALKMAGIRGWYKGGPMLSPQGSNSHSTNLHKFPCYTGDNRAVAGILFHFFRGLQADCWLCSCGHHQRCVYVPCSRRNGEA